MSKQLLCLPLKVWDEDHEELQEVTVSTAAAETCLPAAVAHDFSFRTNGKPWTVATLVQLCRKKQQQNLVVSLNARDSGFMKLGYEI